MERLSNPNKIPNAAIVRNHGSVKAGDMGSWCLDGC